MKFSEITVVSAEPLGVRPDVAAELLGSELVLNLMVKAGWLSPEVSGNRLTIYDYGMVELAWQKLKSEGSEKLKADALYKTEKNKRV
jgi:hypothetical protein